MYELDMRVWPACNPSVLGLGNPSIHFLFFRRRMTYHLSYLKKKTFVVNSSPALVNNASLICHRFQLPKVALVTEKLEFKFLDPKNPHSNHFAPKTHENKHLMNLYRSISNNKTHFNQSKNSKSNKKISELRFIFSSINEGENNFYWTPLSKMSS
jgi:hypothetical protein